MLVSQVNNEPTSESADKGGNTPPVLPTYSVALHPQSTLRPSVCLDTIPREVMLLVVGQTELCDMPSVREASRNMRDAANYFWARDNSASFRGELSAIIRRIVPRNGVDLLTLGEGWTHLLKFLPCTHRDNLLKHGIDKIQEMSNELNRRDLAISNLSEGLKHMTAAARQDLFESAKMDGSSARIAMRGFVKKFHYLSGAQKNELTDKIVSGELGSLFIQFLCESELNLAHLSEGQIAHLVNFSISGTSERDQFLPGTVAPGMRYFTEIQREQLIEKALKIPDSVAKSLVIGRLAGEMEHLNGSQSENLVHAMLDLSDESQRSTALWGLGAGFRYLGKETQQQLIKSIIEMQHASNQARAIAGLGRALAFVADDHRSQLVDVALNLLEEEHKASAIKGLAQGLIHLNGEQQAALVDGTCSMQDEGSKSQAIQALGEGVEHLAFDHREHLVLQAMCMGNEEFRAQSIRGLGTGLKHLSIDSCFKLVDAAAKIVDRTSKQVAWIGLSLGFEAMSLEGLSNLATFWKTARGSQSVFGLVPHPSMNVGI